jgi:drug/metabolite transporter, DME family
VTARSTAARAPLRGRAGLIAVGGSAVLWGTTGVAVTIVHDRTGLTAVSIGAIRLLVAAAVLALWLRPAGVGRAWAMWRRRPVALVLAGLGLGAYQALYFVGIQNVGVSISTLVSLGVAPVLLTVGGAAARRRLPGPASLLILVTAVAGLALVSLRPTGGAAPHPLLGVLASVGSGVGYAATTVLNRRLAGGNDPLLLTGITSVVGGVALLPLALVAGVWWPSDAVAGGWLLYIGVVPTVVAYGLFYLGLRTVPSEVAGVLTLLEPLTAALLAALALHESLSRPGILGAALLLAAIAGLSLRAPEPQPMAPPPG